MKRLLVRSLLLGFLAIVILDVPVFAKGKIKFPVSAIPQNLLSGASAVMRMKTDVFQRVSERRAVRKIDYAVTVLNKSGKSDGYFIQPYSHFSTVSDIRGVVYDKNGKKVKTIKEDDINDIVSDFGMSLYTDIRVKYIDPDYHQYPYTVEYSCEVDYSGSLNLCDWKVVPDYDMAIQKESFSLVTKDHSSQDSTLAVNYYVNMKNVPIQHKVQDGKTIYSLHESNIQAIPDEALSPPLEQVTPTVYFAPASFTIAGYHGGTRSWGEFGAFIRQLNKGRDILPKATQDTIKKLVANRKTFAGKVKAVYQYMQNKVRYVAVEKGIGSWKPMDAEKVDALSYGDCKALANYMKSLLKAAGIKSYYTLVQAGSGAPPMITSFPSNQFDHAIVCVPDKKDTIWLECTNQDIPAGYLGTFTDDRNVLLILGDTVKIAHTTVYDASENCELSRTLVDVTPDGDCQMKVQRKYSGMFYDHILPIFLADAQKQRMEILNTIDLPNFQLQNYVISEKKKALPFINTSMTVSVPSYGTRMGNLLLLKLFPFKQGNDNDFRTKRHTSFLIRRSYSYVDTLAFQMPKGYMAAKIPAPVKVNTPFASCNFSGKRLGNEVIFVRKLIFKKGTYPPSDNTGLANFFDEVNNLVSSKLILVRR